MQSNRHEALNDMTKTKRNTLARCTSMQNSEETVTQCTATMHTMGILKPQARFQDSLHDGRTFVTGGESLNGLKALILNLVKCPPFVCGLPFKIV